MATLEGGIRNRMILESVLRAIEADLTTRGWFDDGEYSPITIIDEYPDDSDEVAANTLAFSLGSTRTEPMELGAKSEMMTFPIFVDMFAESDGLGRHVVGDVYDYLMTNQKFTVYDYRQATPTEEFVVQYVEYSGETRKPDRAVNAWQKHWHVCAFAVMDERSNA
jgi:hypothetical protein